MHLYNILTRSIKTGFFSDAVKLQTFQGFCLVYLFLIPYTLRFYEGLDYNL